MWRRKKIRYKKIYRSEFLQSRFIFVICLLTKVYRKFLSEIYLVGKTRYEDLALKTSMRWSVFFYLCSKLTENLNIWFQLNQWAKIMKVTVSGTSLKESKKKNYNHSARKTTVSKRKKAKIVSSEYVINVTSHRDIS